MSKLIFKAIPANATSAAAEQTLGYIDTTGSTQRVSVKAQPKTVYRLVDAKTGEVIKNQTVVRKGKKLQVMVDTQTINLEGVDLLNGVVGANLAAQLLALKSSGVIITA